MIADKPVSLTPTEQQIADLGHRAATMTDLTYRRQSELNQTPLTQEQFLLRTVSPGFDWPLLDRMVRDLDALLKRQPGGDALFVMRSEVHSLKAIRDNLVACLKNLDQYRSLTK